MQGCKTPILNREFVVERYTATAKIACKGFVEVVDFLFRFYGKLWPTSKVGLKFVHRTISEFILLGNLPKHGTFREK